MNKSLSEHVFLNHLLPIHNLMPEANDFNQEIWPSVFLTFCLVLLVCVRLSSYQKLFITIQSTFSLQALKKIERDDYSPYKISSIALNLFLIFNLSFLTYKLNVIYSFILVDYSKLTQFSFFMFMFIFSFSFKFLINRVLAILTNSKKVIREYTLNCSIVKQTLGLFIFPCVILSEFSKLDPIIFLCAAFFFLIISFFFQWRRGIIIGMFEHRIGLLQIFLYFCTLEILPGLVIIKFVFQTF